LIPPKAGSLKVDILGMPNKKNLYIIGAVAMVGVLGAFAVMQFASETQESAQNNAPTQNEEQAPQATGSIDDSVDAILSESSDDATFSSEEEADASMIIYDDQEVSSFNQTHDETQF